MVTSVFLGRSSGSRSIERTKWPKSVIEGWQERADPSAVNTDASVVGDVRRLADGGAQPALDAPLLGRLVPSLCAALVTLLGLMVFLDPATRRPIASVVSATMIGVLVAVTSALLRLPRLTPQERRAWRTLLLSFTLFLTATVVGLAGTVHLPLRDVPVMGLAREVALISGFGAMVTALFCFPTAPRQSLPRARFALDGAMIFFASSMFLWHSLVAPQLIRGVMSVRTAVLVVTVVGLLAMFVGAMGLLLLQERSPGTREVLVRLVLGVGFVLAGILVSVALGIRPDGGWALWRLALNWSALTLLVSAAVRQRRHVLLREEHEVETTPVSFVTLPYLAALFVFGFLIWVGLGEAPMELKGVLIGAALVGACVLLRQWLLLKENERLREALEHQATRDPLTGVRNRRSWEAEADRQVAQARRHGRALAVLVLDLDGFKFINDAHGHDVGDEVLRDVARCLESSLRAADLAARTGGDEFVVLLPETELSDARLLAETLCLKLGRLRPEAGGDTLRLTASIGAAAMPPAGSLRELVTQADAAMYEAKRQGRNRVHAATTHIRVLPAGVVAP